MFIGSSKPKTDLTKVRKIKEALGENLSIQDNATITVTELTCLEEGCPPVETVVALLKAGSDPKQHKIHKPATEFKAADLTEIAIRWGYPVKPDLFEQFDKEK
ncbi:hypothetical protein OA385_02790 [Paracoccaceae bacterium]|nr:hypothetical protein [Paracoccaceae bacterium]